MPRLTCMAMTCDTPRMFVAVEALRPSALHDDLPHLERSVSRVCTRTGDDLSCYMHRIVILEFLCLCLHKTVTGVVGKHMGDLGARLECCGANLSCT